MTNSNQAVSYNGEWYTFLSDKDAKSARQTVIRKLSTLGAESPDVAVLHVVNAEGTPVQLFVSQGVPLAFQGEWD
jgi:hypothetical protein